VIFATVGTTHFPFDRLVEAVATLSTEEEVVVQRGPSTVAVPGASVVDFLSFDELVEHVRRSRVVISHAGVGSIMVALAHGKRPIVVPRLARFGEAVDDHQVQVATMLGEGGRVRALVDLLDLAQFVSSAEDDSRDGGLHFGPLVDVVAAEVRKVAPGGE
jgi:UDP-N-acetylglucosamine transferase subunit ALG13